MRERRPYDYAPDPEYFATGEHFTPFLDTKRKIAAAMVAAAVILPATASQEDVQNPNAEVRHSREEALPPSLPFPLPGSTDRTKSYAMPATTTYVNQLFQRTPEEEMRAANEKSKQAAYREGGYNPVKRIDIMTTSGAIDYDEGVRNNYRVRKQLADKYGVTVHNYLPTMAKFKDLQQSNGDFDDYFNVTRDFLAKSGTTLRLPDSSRPNEGEFKAPTAAQREMPEARQTLKRIAEAFMGLPEELTDIASNGKGLEVVVMDIPAEEKAGGFTYMDGDHERIFIDAVNSGDNTVEHEIGHNLDAAMSSGTAAAFNDSLFASLNTASNVYAKKTAKSNANEFFKTVDNSYKHIWGESDTPYTQRCKVAKEEIGKISIAAPEVEYFSEYGGSENILEDKAETFIPIIKSGPMLSGWMREAALPRIKQKIRVLTERLATYAPGLAGYLVESKYPAPKAVGIDARYYCDADYRKEVDKHSYK